jgi:transportin-1
MSGLVQGLGDDLGALIVETGLALLGDFAVSGFQFVRPFLDDIMAGTIPQITAEGNSPSVCNNALWAIGEIALQLGPQFQPFVQHLLPRLMTIMNTHDAPAPILENAAIAIGRLGLACSDEIAPELGTFAGPFLQALKDVRDNEEKDSAFRGLCQLIGKNPTGLGGHLTTFVIAAAKYGEPSQELAEMFLTVCPENCVSNFRFSMGTEA